MIKRSLFPCLAVLALAGVLAAPSLVSADAYIWETQLTGPTRAAIAGSYQFKCQAAPVVFPGLPMFIGGPPAVQLRLQASPCASDPSFTYAQWWYSAVGSVGCRARVAGLGSAGLKGGAPSAAAALPDSVDDSLAVVVNRSVAGQVTFGITGFARHYNDAAANAATSRLRITVYPDTANASAHTNAVATGEMQFHAGAKKIASGFLALSDFTAPTIVGNAVQISAVGGLQKTVTGVNVATAVVEVRLDPDTRTNLPGVTPIGLAALASLLLAGATWFLMGRRRTDLA